MDAAPLSPFQPPPGAGARETLPPQQSAQASLEFHEE